MQDLKLITELEYQVLFKKLESIEFSLSKLTQEKNPLEEKWLDNQEAAQFLKVSHRSLQNYRDNGVLPYSTLGGKIFYKAKDIEGVLNGNYKNFNQ